MHTQTGSRALPLAPLIIIMAGLGMIVGTFGPWMETFVRNVNGLDYDKVTGGDGLFVLAGGCVIVIAGLSRTVHPSLRWWLLPLAACVGTGCGILAAHDWFELHRDISALEVGDAAINVGWGVQLATVSSVVGAAASLVAAFLNPR